MAVISPDYFKLNGVESSVFGLYVDTPALPPLSAARYQSYNVGAEQDMTYPDGSYDDITIVLTAYVFDGGYKDINDINRYIASAETLEISRYSGYYFKVKKVNGLVPSHVVSGKHRFNISFVCEPFKYAVNNDFIEIPYSGYPVFYEGSIFGEPLIEVKAVGLANLIIGSTSFAVDNITEDETVYIDSRRKIVYVENTIINNRSAGVFPKLLYGDNQISFNNRVTSVRVQKNERWL
jgi:phage-related protein